MKGCRGEGPAKSTQQPIATRIGQSSGCAPIATRTSSSVRGINPGKSRGGRAGYYLRRRVRHERCGRCEIGAGIRGEIWGPIHTLESERHDRDGNFPIELACAIDRRTLRTARTYLSRKSSNHQIIDRGLESRFLHSDKDQSQWIIAQGRIEYSLLESAIFTNSYHFNVRR